MPSEKSFYSGNFLNSYSHRNRLAKNYFDFNFLKYPYVLGQKKISDGFYRNILGQQAKKRGEGGVWKDFLPLQKPTCLQFVSFIYKVLIDKPVYT